ncbi:MAG: SDR family NAD(P)-dependent oxidoreductase [Helicobacteraceae bacterium]|nr:SDR family NAD(P)-dependent oxidoreductase [Helicobacteraceae bacterium]
MLKYILVTASSRGLGLEIAKELSYAGYNIILTSRSEKNLGIALKQLNSKLKHICIEIDLSTDDVNEKLIKKIEGLNIVSIVHNFGTKLENDCHPIDIDILNQSIYNNFTVSLKINELLYQKLKGDPSKIIYIGSTASLHAKASPSYTLSKSLINTYVKNISSEYLKYNILICAVLPGILGHKGSDWDKKQTIDNNKYKKVKQEQPLGKFSMPNEVSPYIENLINTKNLLITGSIIKLDLGSY